VRKDFEPKAFVGHESTLWCDWCKLKLFNGWKSIVFVLTKRV